MIDTQTFATNLKNRRVKRELSQGQLAARAGVSPQYISNLENGLSLPSLPILTELTRALKCSADDLIDARDEEKNKSAVM